MSSTILVLVVLVICACYAQQPANNSYLKIKGECSLHFKILRSNIRINIVGGSPSSNNEFPHMVALGFGSGRNLQWLCGGTIISENYILTAAHCTNHIDLGPVKMVRLGVQNLKKLKPNGRDIEVSQSIKHPNYKPPSLYNDIALLKLKNSIVFSKSIQPACLNTVFDIRPITSELIATGWGLVSFGGASSDQLLKVQLDLYGHAQCKRHYETIAKRKLARGIDDALQLCAGGRGQVEKDTCQGDSGGPLVFKIGSMYSVVGVTAFGKACGVANMPGVYTRVSAYVSWIEKIIL